MSHGDLQSCDISCVSEDNQTLLIESEVEPSKCPKSMPNKLQFSNFIKIKKLIFFEWKIYLLNQYKIALIAYVWLKKKNNLIIFINTGVGT